MARTKKQTLEKASERKRLIQEEILRESLAAREGSGASSSGKLSTDVSATPSARSRTKKGKQRSRQAVSSPDGVTSAGSQLQTSACPASYVRGGGSCSSSTSRKTEGHRGLSKRSDGTKHSCLTVEVKQTPSSSKGNMPKAILRISDLYSNPTRRSEGDGSFDDVERIHSAVFDYEGSSTTSTLKDSPSATRRESYGSSDHGKHKHKKTFRDSVQASLKSLKAASEMVREEKKRTSRKRSPGSAKDGNSGSGNPSPERRSPRHQSPSNSSETPAQQSVGGKKRGKQKSEDEERPKINIFTDNIGVELGKRIRSPRRLSEDMIALPIFSARRWNNFSREASHIADKCESDPVSAKPSPDDTEFFKLPPAVTSLPSAKEHGNASFKKKGRSSDKTDSSAAVVSDRVTEDSTLVNEMRPSKIRAKSSVTEILEVNSDSMNSDACQKQSVAAELSSKSGDGKTKQNREHSTLMAQLDCETKKIPVYRKGNGQNVVPEMRKQSVPKDARKEDLFAKTNHCTEIENLSSTVCEKESNSDAKSCQERYSSDNTKVIEEKHMEDADCDKEKDVKIEFSSAADLKSEVIDILSKQPREPKSDQERVESEFKLSKSGAPLLESPEKPPTLKCKEGRKQDCSALKPASKKLKGKSLMRSSSGEKKKKQREKMKIVDEELSCICRNIMSGVVITPSNTQEIIVNSAKLNLEKPEHNQEENALKSQYATAMAVMPISHSPVLCSEASGDVEMSPPKDKGLLQPAKNILIATPPEINVTPAASSTINPSISAYSFSSSTALLSVASSMTNCTVSASLSPADLGTVSASSGKQTSENEADTKEPKRIVSSSYSADICVSNMRENVATGQIKSVCSSPPNVSISTNLSKGDCAKKLFNSALAGNSHEEKVSTEDIPNLIKNQPQSIESHRLQEKVKDDKAIESLITVDPASALSTFISRPHHSSLGERDGIKSSESSTDVTPLLSPTYKNKASIVTIATPLATDTKEVSPCFVSVPNKEAQQSSLLCAMLVGGSEVAHTYEKSKPGGVGPSSSTDACEDCQQQVSALSCQVQTSQYNESTLTKWRKNIHSITIDNQAQEEESTAREADNCKIVDNGFVSEKLDSLIMNTPQVQPTFHLSSINSTNEDDTKCDKQASKKDLAIDIKSKLKGIKEHVLKLLDIDVEESFLKTEIKGVLQTGNTLVESEHKHGNIEKSMMDKNPEGLLNPAVKETGEKIAESPLYDIILNLATRLKDQAVTLDVDEMISSCPRHMLKICADVDETTRNNILNQRLREEELKDEKIVRNVNSSDQTLPLNKINEEQLCAIVAEGSTKSIVQDKTSEDLDSKSRMIEMHLPEAESNKNFSPHLTNSSSIKNSLCNRDQDTMTSAVKYACMDVSDGKSGTENVGDLKEIDQQLSGYLQGPHLEEDTPGKRWIHKSKTIDFPDYMMGRIQSTTLRRVNSSPQLGANNFPQDASTTEPFFENFKNKDFQVKSKLGSKIPVPGTSYASKLMKKTWRTPRVILQPKPLSVLSELEESSASKKNIFTCPNLQKYLNVPSNRVIVPPHKKKEMQILDERAKRDEEERATRMAERTDKERAEELINLEYLKYEPDFDEMDGLLFMSFSCEAELAAHVKVEKALEWDKDGTMLRISQAKAFEEAKLLKAGMEKVKFKHLRGQHMRWKKYRRLYSSEVKSILNGEPSSVEEHLRREQMHYKFPKKTMDVTKIKGLNRKTLAKQQLELYRQKAEKCHDNRQSKHNSLSSSQFLPPSPLSSPYAATPNLHDTKTCQHQEQLAPHIDTVSDDSPTLNSSGLKVCDGKTNPDHVAVTGSKRRTGFSHQKQHKQLFRELKMDWEDRMIHRKLGGWSLKGNRPKAFSQAAHKREKKQKMLLGEAVLSNALSSTDVNMSDTVDACSTDGSQAPSQVSSAVDISLSPKDDSELSRRKKPMKLVYPILSERMARNAVKVLVNLGGFRGGANGCSSQGGADIYGGSSHHESGRSPINRHQSDSLPSLQPILPYPEGSKVFPVVIVNMSPVTSGPLSADLSSNCEVRDFCGGLSKATTIGSPAASELLSKLDNNEATPTSLTANADSSVPSSPTPPLSQLSSVANTPSTSAATDIKEDAVMEGVDTAADVVSSPSIADSVSSKSCGKPGCRYGCICHLCSVSEAPISSVSPDAKSLASSCDKEYCRLGCICDSLEVEKPIPEPLHCGKPSCVLHCICSPTERGKVEGGARGKMGSVYSISERLNASRSKRRRVKNKDSNDCYGSDSDNIPHLPSMKRKPKAGERFSNLPQRQKTHRSAKNLDAITRKALMLYETSEIYCEKTERPPRKDQKDLALGLSGTPLDDDTSFSASAIATPVIEIDSPPEDGIMLYGVEDALTLTGVGPQSHPDLETLGYPEKQAAHRLGQGAFSIHSGDNKLSTYGVERPVEELSTHKRKRKSHPLSGEIFTLSTCARTQPYKRKLQKERDPRVLTVPTSVVSGLAGTATPQQAANKNNFVTTSGSAVISSAPNPASSIIAHSSQATPPTVSPAFPAVSLLQRPLSSQISSGGSSCVSTPVSRYDPSGAGKGVSFQSRYHLPWHTSMVCLKARGPPLKKKKPRSSSQPIMIGEDEEEDVQEEDEVKLLEFAANCNWEGARKEILSKVAQCLTRGQYPQPRTMNICEFVVEILPKAHKPSVIPEELRKKLPGKMYSIRVRITRREILPQPQAEIDAQVIDLSDGSPVKPLHVGTSSAASNTLQTFSQQQMTMSGTSQLPINVGISGLSRLHVSSSGVSKSGIDIYQQRSSSAPNSRRSSTEVSMVVPVTVSPVTSSLAQVGKAGASLQVSLNNNIRALSQTNLESSKKLQGANTVSPSVISITSLNSTAPSVISAASVTKSLLHHKTTFTVKPTLNVSSLATKVSHKPVSLLNSSTVSMSKTDSSDTMPASGIMPLFCSFNSNDVKYMKIQGKDGLMKVVGVDKSKKILTMPFPLNQKTGGAESRTPVAAKSGALPYMAVPVCGPGGTKLVPIIPSSLSARTISSIATSTSLSNSPQQFLLKLPGNSSALPHVLGKGSVLLAPVGQQQSSSKIKPLLISSSAKSLLNVSTTSLRTTSSPRLSQAFTQKQISPMIAADAPIKPKGMTSNDEMILAFDAAYLKQLKVSKKLNKNVVKSSTVPAAQQISDASSMTLVTSLAQPIMCSEESPSKLKTDLPTHLVGKKCKDSTNSGTEEGNITKANVMSAENLAHYESIEATSLKGQGNSKALSEEVSDSQRQSVLEGRSKVCSGPNLYVPGAQLESSSLQQIMVYPPASDPKQASSEASVTTTVPYTDFTRAAPDLKIPMSTKKSNHNIIKAGDSKLSIPQTQESVSRCSNNNIPASSPSLSSPLPSSHAPDAMELLLTSSSPSSSQATAIAASSTLQTSIPGHNIASVESSSASTSPLNLEEILTAQQLPTQGVKRKLPPVSVEDVKDSLVTPSGSKRQHVTEPNTQGHLSPGEEEQDSNSSCANQGLGLNGACSFPVTTASQDRPISSMSASLSTTSSDNLLIMLSSD
ncbi:max gene-associated protein, partial [Plakobranchus ocellatus]